MAVPMMPSPRKPIAGFDVSSGNRRKRIIDFVVRITSRSMSKAEEKTEKTKQKLRVYGQGNSNTYQQGGWKK